jgi:hypothetical protein
METDSHAGGEGAGLKYHVSQIRILIALIFIARNRAISELCVLHSGISFKLR